MDDVCIGPQMSECTISSGVCALYDFMTGKVSLCCLPKLHHSHNLFGLSINGNPFTILFVWYSFIPPKFSPNLKCHIQESCWTYVWNTAWVLALPISFLSQCTSFSLLSSLNATLVFVFPFMSGIILNGTSNFLWLALFLSTGFLDACL